MIFSFTIPITTIHAKLGVSTVTVVLVCAGVGVTLCRTGIGYSVLSSATVVTGSGLSTVIGTCCIFVRRILGI